MTKSNETQSFFQKPFVKKQLVALILAGICFLIFYFGGRYLPQGAYGTKFYTIATLCACLGVYLVTIRLKK